MFEVCARCAPGSHATSEGSTSCDTCPEGQYSPTKGWGEDCLECLPGNVTNAAQTGCEPCAAGRYYKTIQTCALCPAGTANPTAGGTLLQCESCPSAASDGNRAFSASPFILRVTFPVRPRSQVLPASATPTPPRRGTRAPRAGPAPPPARSARRWSPASPGSRRPEASGTIYTDSAAA